jgi:antitoxin component YwqK of YwqJK toxin-antitoxin module
MRFFYLICSWLTFLWQAAFGQNISIPSSAGKYARSEIASVVSHLSDSGYFDASGLKSGLWKEHEFRAMPNSRQRVVSYDSLLFYDSLFRNYLTFLRCKGFYDKGKRTGLWKIYSSTSKSIPFIWRLSSTVLYKDGKKEAWEESFGSDSSFSKTYFSNGVRDSVSLSYLKDGQLAHVMRYRNDRLHGTTSFYREDGKLLMEMIYRDGKHETILAYKEGLQSKIFGKYATYYDNGRIRTEAYYSRNGLLDGIYRTYYDNGNPEKEITFSNGEINGLFRSYYDNSQVRSEVSYVKGKPWEALSYYSTKGKRMACGNLKNGEGTVMAYDSNNRLIAIEHYKAGRLTEKESR